ncbi:hypothetical protein Aspvir_006119 [Aspergillus viridinutans]|uniref:Zn(2)-C6 fungal-type domain-containing protein n=1 Tax=Aspergillus viridinutans TaxID=75553 RepID=A0A9P3BYS5_ASPVI|nr:uncharacterized protein Aspvir_006119 [Aspergillus viridinutans]GIK02076.1 hypothetical protein Aspvir_006119 [Aspergillus viridinutans]
MPPTTSARNSLRRGHGCIQCRSRRVKCGNEQPRCSHCMKRHIVCHYMPSWQYLRSTSTQNRAPMDSLPSISVLTCVAQSQSQMSPTGPSVAKDNLNVHDLELMMQWCTKTYRSISHNSNVESIWQTAIPREAMQHPALMHSILALSALHLASSTGGSMHERYIKTAKTHKDLALLGFKETFTNIDQSNCDAAFALSSLLTISSLAFPLIAGQSQTNTALDDLCQAFQVARNSMNVLAQIADKVRSGELKPLLEKDECGPKMPDTSRLAIMSLSMTNSQLANRNPKHERETFEATIGQLGESLEKLVQGEEASIVAFQWMYHIPPRFIDLVHERHPFALVILAHYAVVLHFMRSRWWMGEWGTRIIQQIGRLLDFQWQQSISWVLDATGCYIPPT